MKAKVRGLRILTKTLMLTKTGSLTCNIKQTMMRRVEKMERICNG